MNVVFANPKLPRAHYTNYTQAGGPKFLKIISIILLEECQRLQTSKMTNAISDKRQKWQMSKLTNGTGKKFLKEFL